MQNLFVKCPYCAEDIRQEAKKCKHCGEWLDKTSVEASLMQKEVLANTKPNYIDHHVFGYFIASKDGNTKNGFLKGRRLVVAMDKEDALEKAKKDNPSDVEIVNITQMLKGRLSCPNCASPYTDCSRDIGCVVFLIIFISFGLGLLLVPLLPHKCHCKACGYSWKS